MEYIFLNWTFRGGSFYGGVTWRVRMSLCLSLSVQVWAGFLLGRRAAWSTAGAICAVCSRKAMQDSLGFSPPQLVFVHEVRGPQNTVACSFQPVDKVLIISTFPGSTLSAKFCGPYIVEETISDTKYLIKTSEHRWPKRVCHVNMLKRYRYRRRRGIGRSRSTGSCGLSECIFKCDVFWGWWVDCG